MNVSQVLFELERLDSDLKVFTVTDDEKRQLQYITVDEDGVYLYDLS